MLQSKRHAGRVAELGVIRRANVLPVFVPQLSISAGSCYLHSRSLIDRSHHFGCRSLVRGVIVPFRVRTFCLLDAGLARRGRI
jgi:hypothetical protein